MGSNITCHNCCVEREYYAGIKSIYTPGYQGDKNKIQHPDLMEAYITLPDTAYARPVSNVIDMTAAVRRTYKEQKQPQKSRIVELRGTALQSYYLFNWNAYYDGEWKDGLPHGQGRANFDSGSLYEGTFNQGVIEGDQGLFIFPNGSFYKGAFRRDKAHGIGTFRSESVIYGGEWQNSLPHGKGLQITQSCKYEGQFLNGKKQGRGILKWGDQCQYIGEFANNQMEGRGTLRTNQYTYEGQMHLSKKHGYGKLTYKNCDVYEGYFIEDDREGDGIFTWSTGTKYIGKFETDRQNGDGKLSMPDGKVFQGNWVNGQLIGTDEDGILRAHSDANKQNKQHTQDKEQDCPASPKIKEQ